MREVNFSIPSANKASVGITQQLYDRRALDTTSTLPLINSLNNLAFLTTSSVRIRDILTVDGGIERLVSVLKEGRNSKDMMELWKWNLAFQCVVNIGIRGSEAVRTRVVEADMVPVIATLLHNYISVMDKVKEKADQSMKKPKSSRHRSERSHDSDRNRRVPPPPIDIPAADRRSGPFAANLPLSSPPDRPLFVRRHTQNQRSLQIQPDRLAAVRNGPLSASMADALDDGDASGAPTPVATPRPVRDIDRLPSMIPGLQAEFAQPESPTTPNGAPQLPNILRGGSPLPVRRPAIRHQLSVLSQDDILQEQSEQRNRALEVIPDVGLQTDLNMEEIEDETTDGGGSPVRVEVDASIGAGDALGVVEDFPPSGMDSTPSQGATAPSPTSNLNIPVPPPVQLSPYARFVREASRTMGSLPNMPSDGDILMCLQLLAYVSKYCNLRTYFQQSHLVPRLKTSEADLAVLDGEEPPCMDMDEDPDAMEEYLQPDDFNIFPLVEKFTVRHHTTDLQYWARVVMRNLCRRDDSRGGIRQCAYYKCGKWEKYTREFAKCRRCRRTKYCSKECQKLAWVYHRHWCVEAAQSSAAA